MAKLIQICASQNDLFGLDGAGRGDLGGSSLAEDATAITHPESHRAAPADDAEPAVRRYE